EPPAWWPKSDLQRLEELGPSRLLATAAYYLVFSELELHLHRLRSIARQFEGLDRIFDREGRTEKRLQVDAALANEIDRQPEFLMEAERALHLDFLGNDKVLGDRNITAEAELYN